MLKETHLRILPSDVHGTTHSGPSLNPDCYPVDENGRPQPHIYRGGRHSPSSSLALRADKLKADETAPSSGSGQEG